MLSRFEGEKTGDLPTECRFFERNSVQTFHFASNWLMDVKNNAGFRS